MDLAKDDNFVEIRKGFSNTFYAFLSVIYSEFTITPITPI